MTDIVWLIACFGGGAALGLLYFGGLWYTVQRVTDSQYPNRLLVGSFLARAIVVLVGFYGVMQVMGAQWEGLAVSLVGFMGMRLVLVRRWGPAAPATMSNT